MLVQTPEHPGGSRENKENNRNILLLFLFSSWPVEIPEINVPTQREPFYRCRGRPDELVTRLASSKTA
jgi:hypothetical protein